jgi:predicted dienelactone hydrolase
MRIFKLVALLAITTLSSLYQAQAAGLKFIEVPSNDRGPALTGAVWYPCAQTPVEIKVHIERLKVVQDRPLTREKDPLIVVSHGAGGWFGNYYALTAMLADAGFVVAAINHPRDSGRSPTRDPGDIASMTERPADMTRLVDFMLGAWPGSSQIDPARIGFFGFSRGGFTGLGMVGGNPDWKLLLDNCPIYPGNRFCQQIRSSAIPTLASDSRIKAAVLADPAGGSLFTTAGLSHVTVPLQLWASEHGGDGLSPRDAATVAQNLPFKPDYRIVPNSGHFSFLPPCSPEFVKRVTDFGEPELCEDMEGFNRFAFHKQFNADTLTFFRKHLVEAKQ